MSFKVPDKHQRLGVSVGGVVGGENGKEANSALVGVQVEAELDKNCEILLSLLTMDPSTL